MFDKIVIPQLVRIISNLIRKLQDHFFIPRILPLVHNLSQLIPVYPLTPYFFKM
jgi:hypothetical protein